MKTNFISNLKHLVFLFIAILGTISGYAQADQNSNNADIGGKSSDTGLGLFGIGGSQGTPRGTGLGFLPANTKTDCIFTTPSEIGGRGTGGQGTSSDTGQFNDDDVDPYYIGRRGTNSGTGTGELAYLSDIGGKGTTGGDTGQRTNPNDTDPYDTGGRGTDLGTGLFAYLEYIPGVGCLVETGGRDSGGGLQNADTGGGKSSDGGLGRPIIADTGGRNGHGTGTSTTGDYGDDGDDDTGGRGSSGTAGEFAQMHVWVNILN